MDSIWTKIPQNIPYQTLDGSLTVDVAVIGGGLAGLLTAYFLKDAGLNTIVIEKNRIGEGVTAASTAKITSQHGFIYSRLLKKSGEKAVRQYARYNEQAIRQYASLIKKENISCDYETANAALYDTTNADALIREAVTAKAAGIAAEFTTNPNLPFQTAGAVTFYNQAQFHPLKFLYGIAGHAAIYQDSPAVSVKKHTVEVYNKISQKTHQVQAKHIVIATHYPFINFPGMYFMRMYQSASYVLALKNVPPMDAMYIGTADSDYSLRNYKDMLLFGGGRHRTGIIPDQNPYDKLRSAVKAYFPNAVEVSHWSAQDCMPLREVPYIGRFSNPKDNIYIATGFQKWGISSSMIAATIITNQIQTPVNTLNTVFSPKNKAIRSSCLPVIQNMAVSMKNLLIPRKGPRCPHLGCALAWNPFENTWDCPCHGSRFDKKGRIISNPAQKDLFD